MLADCTTLYKGRVAALIKLVGLYIIIYVKVYSGGGNVIDIDVAFAFAGKIKLYEFYLNVTRWR